MRPSSLYSSESFTSFGSFARPLPLARLLRHRRLHRRPVISAICFSTSQFTRQFPLRAFKLLELLTLQFPQPALICWISSGNRHGLGIGF